MADSPNLTVMIKAAEKAARSLVRDFGEVEKLQISVKGPGDFVSKADKRSEEIIIDSLQYDRPEWGILAEESGAQAGSDPRYRFIIDPLDGTTNFLHGLPHWCVTIALEKDGEVIAGVTYDPIRQEMFRAEKGTGAFCNRARLKVGGKKVLKDTLLCFTSVSFGSEHIEKLKSAGALTRVTGSAALDLAYVAAGRFDLATGRKPAHWDVAAGHILVREAKGLVTNRDLKPGNINVPGYIAANPTLHAEYAALLGLV